MAASRMGAEEVREAVRAGGLLAQDRPVVAMLSGGRDSVCLLDVAVAAVRAGDVRALHVNYGLRAEADADERHCVALCGGWACELEVVRAARQRAPSSARGARQPAGVGARAALRGGRAAGRRAGRRRADRAPATRPPTRWRRSSIASPPRRAGARCWVWRRAKGGSSARCWA